jgi:hypothetical protein
MWGKCVLGLSLGIGLLSALACGGVAPNLSKGGTSTSIVRADDGHSQITLPAGWKQKEDLSDNASIQVANSRKAAFLIVISESKRSYADDFTLKEHFEAKFARLVKALKNSNIGPMEETTVSGRPAMRVRMSGENIRIRMKVTYVNYSIDGETHFHQVQCWSEEPRFAPNVADFEAILASFKDLP